MRIDLNNACRTCKCESPEMKSLYYRDSESGKENPRLDEMLMACASVQVSNDDGLPKLICRSCYVLLKNAYAFKEQCEKTEVFFKEYLKKANVKEETLLGDLEYLANVTDDISSEQADVEENRNESEEIKDDPEVHTDQVVEKSMDYVQVFDENIAIYRCRICSKDFYTLEGLKFHKRVHSGRTFSCKQCNKSYTRLHHLYRHELSHTRSKVCVCKICNKTLTRLDHLKKHLITHLKEKPFVCSKCGRGFNRTANLENHVARCKGEQVYICDICNKAFNRQDSMEVHRKTHQNKIPVLPTLESIDNVSEYYMEIDYNEKTVFIDESEAEEEEGEEEEDEDFDVTEETVEPEVEVSENHDQVKIDEIAEITKEIYAEEDPPEMMLAQAKIKEEIYRESRNADVEADNGNPCNSDDSKHSEYLPMKPLPKIKRGRGRPRKHPVSYKPSGRPRGRPPSKHKVKPEPKPISEEETGHFKCPQCNIVFTTLFTLERHAEQHHDGLKLHECETCKKKYSRLNSLKRHKLVHLETKPFVCGTCLKCFSRRDHMLKHMRLHNSSNAHTCNVCQAVFSCPENLMRHEARKHGAGEKVVVDKKYECDYCMKTFTTERYRDSHMKAHLGEKRHQCKTCEKTFISKSHLNEHMKFHNDSSKNFLCSECGQRFIRNDYLVIHMRRHRGEKPFKCKFCGKGFPRTTDLTVHERYHTGEKTHLCVICGRGFGRAYNLTVHMRTHTGEKPYRCTYCDAAFAQGNDLKAHVRRHTGERFQCDICPETFLMGYLLTQHKRVVHGLNIVSNIRRLQPTNKINPDDPPPITVPLPAPVIVSAAIMVDPLEISKTEIAPEELKQE